MPSPAPLSPDAPSPLATVLDLARTQRMSLPDVFQAAERLNAAGKPADAAEIYKTWIAYNDAHPLLHLVHFNHSVTLRQMGDLPGAINALRACLKLDPDFGAAHINLGRALEDGGQAAQAIQQWRVYAERTAHSTPDLLKHRLMTLQHIGRVMENAGLMEEAEAALWQAIELRPEKTEAGQHWSALRQRQCKWPILTPSEHASARSLIDSMSPLALGCYADDPLFQLAKAYRYAKSLVGHPDTSAPPRRPPRRISGTGERLRIGYVSSDLRDHAVGFALREVFELHDKASLEVFAYYIGEPVATDETQTRMKAAVDGWHDMGALSDQQAARRIHEDGLDILIDVNGYTKHARTRIFAYRPAPVIVNFCGYPGSMGTPFHNYLIADAHVIPPQSQIYYSEKVLHIACTQPIDRKRAIAERPTRAQAGLPADSFVFACFNGSQKITAETFGLWMQILAATPGSLLWLLTTNETVDQRLRDLAAATGIAPERLVFAPKAPNARHLARIAVADLFLDTFPYGAHSTAGDALTVGLPVLTFPGKTFAARFCASIVAAAGIPDFICRDPQDYVARAIAVAREPKRLKAVRAALDKARETSALRDIPGLARRLETLYRQMQAAAEAGETPVPDLTNLDVYYEVGAELVQENTGWQDEAAYLARYREKLAELDAYAPLPNDHRLWPAASGRLSG